MRIGRQFTIFTGVGLVVVAVHYAMLIALVESGLVEPVKANLASYVAGGIVSYLFEPSLDVSQRASAYRGSLAICGGSRVRIFADRCVYLSIPRAPRRTLPGGGRYDISCSAVVALRDESSSGRSPTRFEGLRVRRLPNFKGELRLICARYSADCARPEILCSSGSHIKSVSV